MVVREKEAAWADTDTLVFDHERTIVAVSSEEIARRPELFDRVFAFAFDTLGLQSLELQVHAQLPTDKAYRS